MAGVAVLDLDEVVADLPVLTGLVQPGDPAVDLLEAARIGTDHQNRVQAGNGKEADGRLLGPGIAGKDDLQFQGQVGGPGVLERIDADALAAEHGRVEDPDQLQQFADVGGSVGDDEKVGGPVIGDVAALRQEGIEQLGHVGGRHEVDGDDLKHPAVPGGGSGGCRVAPDVQGQLFGIAAGKDAIDGPRLDNGGAVDLEDGLEQRHEVAASHLAVGEDVDHSLHLGIDQVVQLQLVGDVADELQQVAVHAIEAEAGVGSGRPRRLGGRGSRRIGSRFRPGRGGFAGSGRIRLGLDRGGSDLGGVGAGLGLGPADDAERRPDQLELRFRFLGLRL